jgi:hypothetical protein
MFYDVLQFGDFLSGEPNLLLPARALALDNGICRKEGHTMSKDTYRGGTLLTSSE